MSLLMLFVPVIYEKDNDMNEVKKLIALNSDECLHITYSYITY